MLLAHHCPNFSSPTVGYMLFQLRGSFVHEEYLASRILDIEIMSSELTHCDSKHPSYIVVSSLNCSFYALYTE